MVPNYWTCLCCCDHLPLSQTHPSPPTLSLVPTYVSVHGSALPSTPTPTLLFIITSHLPRLLLHLIFRLTFIFEGLMNTPSPLLHPISSPPKCYLVRLLVYLLFRLLLRPLFCILLFHIFHALILDVTALFC